MKNWGAMLSSPGREHAESTTRCNLRHLPKLMAAAAFAVMTVSQTSEPAMAVDRPSERSFVTRSPAVGKHGMAATSQPLASQAAIEILQLGGNAVDAAIAANAVLGVTEPMSCGLGGDLFAIIWDSKTRKLHGLNASGRAPYAATIELYRARGLSAIPTDGPLSWSVPGCVDGWDQLRARFGTKPWAELLAPAIAYAEEGFPVSELCAADW